jgi:hypothetical protein
MNVYLKNLIWICMVMFVSLSLCYCFLFFCAIFTILTSYLLQVLNSSGLKMDVDIPVDWFRLALLSFATIQDENPEAGYSTGKCVLVELEPHTSVDIPFFFFFFLLYIYKIKWFDKQ